MWRAKQSDEDTRARARSCTHTQTHTHTHTHTWHVLPFCWSSMWNRNPSSQARQNSLSHRWLMRAHRSGSMKYNTWWWQQQKQQKRMPQIWSDQASTISVTLAEHNKHTVYNDTLPFSQAFQLSLRSSLFLPNFIRSILTTSCTRK